jgi:hypothetical protein
MKLMTAAIAKTIPAIYETEAVPAEQKMVAVKFFDPCGAGTWFAFEADVLVDAEKETWMPLKEAVKKKVPYSEVKFFGLTTGLGHPELGYFLLSELQRFRGRFGLGIERDLHYTPDSLADLQRKAA